MVQRILVVCVGNICRSPTAEVVLRHYLPHLVISSAGLAALSGQTMDPTALAVLQANGLDGSGHIARQLYDRLIRQADLVLGMEQNHVETIQRQAPEAIGRIFMLDKWGDQQDIPDPYRQPRANFEHVYGMIDAACQAWLPYLRGR
jgi:protein-tyrosine phosphatase